LVQIEEAFANKWGCDVTEHETGIEQTSKQNVLMETLEVSDVVFFTTVFICRGKAHYRVFKKKDDSERERNRSC
jgi:hypothetical protein